MTVRGLNLSRWVCGIVAWVGFAAGAQAQTVLTEQNRVVDATGQVVSESSGPAEPAQVLTEAELVTERYKDGAVKSQRWVVLNERGDFVNHGAYKAYDRHGNLIGTGEYRHGKEHGMWTRHFATAEGTILARALDQGFEAPYTCEIELSDGKLHGTWTAKDKAGRLILQWEFNDGVRDGLSSWYYSGGQKRSEVPYKNGKMHGDFVQWDVNGRPTGKAIYVEGRRLAKKVDGPDSKRKLSEGWYLEDLAAVESHYDWWNGVIKMAPVQGVGGGVKHGEWTYWYPNGKTKMVGKYQEDLPVGSFTWWYANGQKQTEGTYVKGLQDGEWTGWHDNGMKKYVGTYNNGEQVGRWMVWNADGKRAEVHDYGKGGRPVEQSLTGSEATEGFEEMPLEGQRSAGEAGPSLR